MTILFRLKDLSSNDIIAMSFANLKEKLEECKEENKN